MGVLKFLMDNWSTLLNGLMGVFAGLAAMAMVIPGEQPEKFFQGVVDFLAKFSRK